MVDAATPSPSPATPDTATPGEAPVTRRGPRRVWDLVLTIVFIVFSLAGAAVASFLGLFVLAFGSDSCVVRECNYDVMSTGMMVAFVGPWIPVVIATIVAIVLLVLRRLAFWVPLVGGVLSVGVLILGFAIAASGVPAV